MSYFGHVYPGLFYIGYAATVLLWARQRRDDDPESIVLGSRREMIFSALYFFICFAAGIGIEGAGGIITFNDFFYQYSHQVSYVGYLVAGLASVLELCGRLGRGSWKVAFAFSMLVEGWVMVGHLVMQEQPESTLHLVMTVMSFFVATCLFFSVFASSVKVGVFLQSCALAGMLTKGLWFFYIAEVVYSGKYGHQGEHAHMGDIVATAGLLAVCCEAVVGAVMGVRCGGNGNGTQVVPVGGAGHEDERRKSNSHVNDDDDEEEYASVLQPDV